MKKRTKRLDDEREVLLWNGPNGPVHSTVGELKTTPDDRGELQDSVNKQFLHGSYLEVARAHHQAVAGFFIKAMMDLSPEDVYADWAKNGANGEYFQAWQARTGINFHLDGLNAYIRRRETVIAELPVKLPEKAHAPVLACFRQLLVNEAKGLQ